MGMAHKAPDTTYQRQFVISNHAIERYRERVEKEHAARSDFDLGNLLDERIRSAERHQTVTDTRNIESVTRVFELEHRNGAIYFAVVRDMTVVTILDEKMLKLNFDNGSWKPGPMNMPFNRKSLRGIVPEENAMKGRKGLPPGVPPLPVVKMLDVPALAKPLDDASVQQRIHDERPVIVPASNPVADAGARLGDAMVAHSRAQQHVEEIEAQIRSLELQRIQASMKVDNAAEEVRAAQVALADAVESITKR